MSASIVLITGASAGIGHACVLRFLEAGATVIGWSRREVLVPSEHTERFIHQSVDVRDQSAVHAAYESLAPQLQHIDVLVNNAGLSRGLSPLQEGSDVDWEEMIDTNIKGLLWVTRTVLPGMVDRGSGTIINISSIAGRQAYRGGNVYGATKAAVKMLSENLQLDVNGTGVRVCNIDPGMVETEFSLVRYRGDAERAATVYQGFRPLSGMDVANVVEYVASLPAHVCIQDILLMPTDQASVNLLNRRT